MMTYGEALEALCDRLSVKVDHNTHLRVIDGSTLAVRLYSTDVVLIHKNGTYTLNAGGYETVTTKDRINKYSPARVYAEKRVWWVGRDAKRRVEFRDGIKVNARGEVV